MDPPTIDPAVLVANPTGCPAGLNCAHNIPVLVAKVAEILDNAGAPNFLWGWAAMSLLGPDYKYPEIDFVIPSSKLPDAQRAMIAAGYTHCRDTNCSTKSDDKRRHLVADAHFHDDAEHLHHNYTTPDGPSFAGIRLYAKERLAWWIPETKVTLGPVISSTRDKTSNASIFMLTTAPSILQHDPFLPPSGTGRWRDLYPVKILRPARLYEALHLLQAFYLYDVDDHGDAFGELWLALLACRSNGSVIDEITTGIKTEFHQLLRHQSALDITPAQMEADPARNTLPLLTLRWRLVVGDLEQSVGRPPLPVERGDGPVVMEEDGAKPDERGD